MRLSIPAIFALITILSYSPAAKGETHEFSAVAGAVGNASSGEDLPNAPSNLSAEPRTNSTIHLSWTDNSTDEEGFHLYRDGRLFRFLEPNTTTYDDDRWLCAGIQCCYEITAHNSYGESPPSNQACAIHEPAEVYVDDDAICPGTGTMEEPYCQIQLGIDNAWCGDTVVVRDGRYTSGGSIIDKLLVVRSENGPENCIVDGAGFSFGIRENMSEDVMIEGFTITNNDGHGIRCGSDVYATVADCIITGNSGRGISILGIEVSFTLTDSIISGNLDGGIEIQISSLYIRNCSINGNSAQSNGGGIYLEGWAHLSIENSTISDNSATSGGGISSYHSSISARDCAISRNTAERGGGIWIEEDSSHCSLTESRIDDNVAQMDGGGIHATGCHQLNLTNVIMSGNSSLTGKGGALHNSSAGSSSIIHSTIVHNTSSNGGAIVLGGNSAVITNSLFWGNSSGISLFDYAALAVDESDIEDGPSAITFEPGCALNWGATNINSDPLLSEDWHLTCFSPCIDACADTGVSLDIDGDIRPQQASFDMGADEYMDLDLTAINLLAPSNESAFSTPPTFRWKALGGCDNGFSVDIAFSPGGPIYSTYETLHQVIRETSWAMPAEIWQKVPVGKIYWRVRGADLNDTPLNIITSEEVWSFQKGIDR